MALEFSVEPEDDRCCPAEVVQRWERPLCGLFLAQWFRKRSAGCGSEYGTEISHSNQDTTHGLAMSRFNAHAALLAHATLLSHAACCIEESRRRPVGAKEKTPSLGKPVPELPVADVERAQHHYRDALGFAIGWLYPGKEIGAVSREDIGPIFFCKREPPFEPAVHWVFAENIDASYLELKSTGANIVEPLGKKTWGLRQFTLKDLDGNLFYFHHD
jgi:predicted enzyme related to lactoylglutathione lyase